MGINFGPKLRSNQRLDFDAKLMSIAGTSCTRCALRPDGAEIIIPANYRRNLASRLEKLTSQRRETDSTQNGVQNGRKETNFGENGFVLLHLRFTARLS